MSQPNPTTGEIKSTIDAPKLLVNKKLYLDFSTVVEYSKLSKTSCFRALKEIEILPQFTIIYKNRSYFLESFIFLYFKDVH